MDKRDFVIIWLSLQLGVISWLWAKDIRVAEYQRGRADVLEVMAEINYEAAPYTVPPKKQVRHK